MVIKDKARVDKVRAFLRDAFSDYIAARVLLLANLPQQGAILSSTAIEKCIKAVLALSGNVKHGHLNDAHWNVLQDFDANAKEFFDPAFIKLNAKVYKLRYTDVLPNDFNLVIASREFLAEMDHTVNIIMSSFKIDEKGKRQKTLFQHGSEAGDLRLLAENHMVTGPRKELFIHQKPQFVYEIRRDRVRGLIEATYSTDSAAKVPGFLRQALLPSGKNNADLEFSHFPLQGPDPRTDHDIRVSFSA